jgi:hypothetical protein
MNEIIISEIALQKFRQRVKPCLEPGNGAHRWTFHAACLAVDAGLPDEIAVEEIESLMTRDPKPGEIEDALASARGERRRSVKWAKVNEEKVEAITQDGPPLVELWKSSPLELPIVDNYRTESIIDLVFPGDPLLCVGQSNDDFETKRRTELAGKLHDRGLIVASPMIAPKGRTQKGYLSAHTLENTGPRRFVVIEFDRATLDAQAALIHHLSKIAPSLALVAFSGGKSLHSWFYCATQTEETQLQFMRYAVSLGADRATWTRSQFVRMPDGTRRDGKTSAALEASGIVGVPAGKQVALYLNPEVVQ